MSDIKITECRCCGNRDAKQFVEKGDGYICKCCGVWFRYETEEERDGCLAGYRQLRKYNFEDARDTFEEVLINFPKSIDARWGLLLARYGVVYIKGFYDDVIEPVYCFPDYEVLNGRSFQNEDEYKEMRELIGSDTELKYLYDAKAREIDRAIKKFRDCKGSTERDVFICVKISASTEKEKHGVNERTKDYEFALKAYKDLQARGKNVFFSFVTLKNEVNSDDLIWLNLVKSKKLLLIGSREDYLESAWVKSEWKRWRFLERQKDMYICVLNNGGDNPKNILPYELRKDAPQIYTNDTYAKLLDDICEVEYNAGMPYATTAQASVTAQADAPQAPSVQASATSATAVQAPVLYRSATTPASLNAILAKIEADKKEKDAYAGKDGKIVYKDGREEVLKYGIHMIKAKQYAKRDDIVKVIIPSSVTEIGTEAFSGCGLLSSIIIPDSVNLIGALAFNCCWVMRHLTLPKNLTRIHKNTFFNMCTLESIYIPEKISIIHWEAFKGCKNLKSIYFGGYKDEWENITIEDHNEPIQTAALHFDIDGKIVYADGRKEVLKHGITKIKDGAYSENEDIVSVILPDSIVTIGNRAFFCCSNLVSVTMQNGVKTIMEGAFAVCSSLRNVEIPDSVKTMGKGVFYGCDELSRATLSSSLAEIPKETFGKCENLTAIDIPRGVTNIGEEAFLDCYKLAEVTIPETVTEIGIGAFKNCYALARISIPDSAEWIRTEAFASCNRLIYARIGAEEIDKRAFSSCTKLAKVELSENVKMIKEHAFSQCYGLENQDFEIPPSVEVIEGNPFFGYKVNLTVASSNRYYGMIDGNLYRSNGKELVAHFTSDEDAPFTIPNSVVKIGAYAFSSVGARSVIMPNTVKEFGCGAFMDKTDAASFSTDMVLAVDDIYFKGKKAEWESILVNYIKDRKETDRRTMTIGDIIKNTTRYSKPTVLPRVHFKTLFGYTK